MKRLRLIFGLLLMVIGGAVVWQMNDLRSTSEEAASWPHVIGTIAEAELDFEKDARIRYQYAVAGHSFESRRLFFGVVSNDDIYLKDGSTLSDGGLIARFPAGSEVKVYYDPADPTRAVLLPTAEHNTKFVTLFFGYGFIAVGFLLAASGIFGSQGRGSSRTGNILLRVLIGGGMLAAGIATISFMTDIRSENRMARLWPSVAGKITFADVWGDRTEVAYTYRIDGKEYLSDQLYIGVPTKRITLEDGKELWPRQLDRMFKLDEPVDVYADPGNPANAILLPTARHNTEVPIYIGYAMAVMGPLVALFGKFSGAGSSDAAPGRQERQPSNGGKMRTAARRRIVPQD